MIKSSTGAFSWIVIDTARDTANAAGLCLIPNLSNAENGPTGLQVDILSNGFKLRNTDGNLNGAQTYIFAAFAETAFRYALAR